MKTFITESELKNRVEKLKAYTDVIAEAEKKTMSRAAKGNEKYGKDGMKELAAAGRDGASEEELDKIRDKHDKYDESTNDTQEESLDASPIGESVGFCSDDSLVRILAITNRVIK
jgi:phage shock protein A